jgi:hypothetical protein
VAGTCVCRSCSRSLRSNGEIGPWPRGPLAGAAGDFVFRGLVRIHSRAAIVARNPDDMAPRAAAPRAPAEPRPSCAILHFNDCTNCTILVNFRRGRSDTFRARFLEPIFICEGAIQTHEQIRSPRGEGSRRRDWLEGARTDSARAGICVEPRGRRQAGSEAACAVARPPGARRPARAPGGSPERETASC